MRHPGFVSVRAAALLVTMLLTSLLLAACGGQPTADPTATAAASPTPTVTDILEHASRQIADTSSVHYELTISGDTFLDTTETIRLLDAEGDLQRPDRVYSSFRAEIVGRTITLQLITVGPDSWTTDILTGEWVPAPGEFAYKPGILFDTQEGIGPVMDSVAGAERLPDTEVNGRPAYHLRATVDQETIGPLTSYLLTGPDVTVNLWIDRETYDLLRAELSQPATEPDGEPTTWTLDLSRHGEDVSIEPPV